MTVNFKTQVSLFFFILFFSSYAVSGQNCTCDNASWSTLEKLRDDNDSVAIQKTIIEWEKSSNPACKVYAYTLKSLYFLANKKADSLQAICREQEKYVNGLACKSEMNFQVSLNYVRYYKRKNNYDSMAVWAYKALQEAESQKNKETELLAIKEVVYLLTRQNEDDKIPAYTKRAEKIIEQLPENYLTAAHYNWLAFEYETWYTRTERKSLVDSALTFADKAILSAKQYYIPEQLTQSFRAYEALSYHKGDIRKAVTFMDSALYYAKQIKVATNLGALYIAKASDLLDLGEKAEAIRSVDTSIYYVEKDFHGAPSSVNVYLQASQTYEAAGDLSKSLSAYKTYARLKDSLFTLQRSQQINELETKYNKAQDQQKIKTLGFQKKTYLLLALAGLFALLGLIFFIRQQSLRNKKKILETEQRLNRARMNPHFFFNALSSLQSYALEGNDGKSIASNLSKFSHIMRETLESTYKEYVTIEQETDFLKEYLELQKIRFPQKFSYTISVSNTVEPDETVIPSMILQPFAENSIEHGFTGIDYPGEIIISFDKKDKELIIAVSDNGKGLAAIPKENTEHISRASQIIKDRIYLLNIKLKTKASFSIDNNSNGKGVTVMIRLPLLFKADVKA